MNSTCDWYGNPVNARMLANFIRDFWRQRGYHKIDVAVIKREIVRPDGLVRRVYDIRSNMLNGVPPS